MSLHWDHADLALYYSRSYLLLQTIHDMLCPSPGNDNGESDYSTLEDYSLTCRLNRTEGIAFIETVFDRIVSALIGVALCTIL